MNYILQHKSANEIYDTRGNRSQEYPEIFLEFHLSPPWMTLRLRCHFRRSAPKISFSSWKMRIVNRWNFEIRVIEVIAWPRPKCFCLYWLKYTG